MKPTATLKADSFHSQMQIMRDRSVVAGRAAAGELGGVLFRKLIRFSREAFDTARYMRAWQMAYNSTGIARVPLEKLRTSRWAAQNRARLQRQADKWALERERWVGIVVSYQGRPSFKPSWKSYKEAVRILDSVGDLEDSALEQLEAIDRPPGEGEGPAVFIAGRKSRARSDFGKGSARSKLRISQIERALLKIHGGDGKLIRQGDTWLVYGVNKEPHARIVEKQKRIMARAIADAKGAGFTRKAAKQYLGAISGGLNVKAPGAGAVATLSEAA